jgi:hypothetical protein
MEAGGVYWLFSIVTNQAVCFLSIWAYAERYDGPGKLDGALLFTTFGALAGAWLTLQSSFLFRGAFSDHAATFRRSPLGGTSFTLALPDAASVAVLASKPWLRLAAAPVPAAGGEDARGGGADEATAPAKRSPAGGAAPAPPRRAAAPLHPRGVAFTPWRLRRRRRRGRRLDG